MNPFILIIFNIKLSFCEDPRQERGKKKICKENLSTAALCLGALLWGKNKETGNNYTSQKKQFRLNIRDAAGLKKV